MNLVGGRTLAASTLWNLTGYLAPFIVAFVTIPVLVRGLGADRFGLLSLAWVLVGAFSIVDLGLGRAVTYSVANAIGLHDLRAVPQVVWSMLLLMLVLGLLVATSLGLLAPWMVHSAMRVPPSLIRESLNSIYVLAPSIPLVLATSGLRGVLEAQQRFGLSNIVRIPLGVMSFLAPVIALAISASLVGVIAALVLVRLGAFIAYLVLCIKATPGLALRPEPHLSRIVFLLRTGLWISITNVISPLVMYADRLLIASMISVAAVTYYAVPYDVTARILVVPAAITGVLFPAFATSFTRDPRRAELLMTRGSKYVYVFLLPITALAIAFAPQLLGIWLGSDFANHSGRVLQVLATGVFFNGLANIPFALVQGIGRADASAKLHLVEFPLYLLALVGLLSYAGIVGAAFAFMLRSFVDMVALYLIAFHFLQAPHERLLRMSVVFGTSVLVMFIVALVPNVTARAALALTCLVVFALAIWRWGLSADEHFFIAHVPILSGLRRRAPQR